MTVHELRERAESIAMALEEALAAVERAKDQAVSLYREIGGTRVTELVRFDYEVQCVVRSLACDMGAEDLDGPDLPSSGSGSFDIDRLPIDARDLLDLIDLGAERKRADVHVHGDRDG